MSPLKFKTSDGLTPIFQWEEEPKDKRGKLDEEEEREVESQSDLLSDLFFWVCLGLALGVFLVPVFVAGSTLVGITLGGEVWGLGILVGIIVGLTGCIRARKAEARINQLKKHYPHRGRREYGERRDEEEEDFDADFFSRGPAGPS